MSADDIVAGMAKVAIAEPERFYDTNTGETNEDEDQGLSTLYCSSLQSSSHLVLLFNREQAKD